MTNYSELNFNNELKEIISNAVNMMSTVSKPIDRDKSYEHSKISNHINKDDILNYKASFEEDDSKYEFVSKNKENQNTHSLIKYINKPKELPEGQNVIITPYEDKNNSEVKPQETNKVLMYVPEYVKEADGKITVETKAVEKPEVIITPPPVAIEKPKEVQEVTNQVENQQTTQTTVAIPVQYAKSKVSINSIINNPIFSVFTYLDVNYRKKHPLPPSPFGSLVAADPDYTKPQETARSMFVDWEFCDSNYGDNVIKIDYIEYSTFKLFTNVEFLKFIGQYNQQPLFKVYFNQNDEHHLILIAEDENGIIQIDHNRFLNQNNTNVKYNSRSSK